MKTKVATVRSVITASHCLSLVPPSGKPGEDSSKRLLRVRLGIHTPVLEVLSNSTVSGITPAPTVAYLLKASLEITLPERSVELDRKNLRAYLNGILNNYQFTGMVDDLLGLTG